jgi:hypothetical protein
VSDDAFTGDRSPSSERGNGLRADNWVSVCDVDPRLAAPLLEALRDASIPAYIAPAQPDSATLYPVQLPIPPIDRLWVDASLRREAEQLVSVTLPELRASLEDERWAELVKSLESDDTAERRTGQEVEASTSASTAEEPAYEILPPAPVDDDHFVPPDPPLQPLDSPHTRYGWIALIGGCLLLLLPAMAGKTLGTGWLLIAVASIIGGFVLLVLRMKDSPPTDSGPDDGAVV